MASAIENIARKLIRARSHDRVQWFIGSLREAVRRTDGDPCAGEYRRLAKEHWEEEGQVEIDDDAVVSVSDDGAYVQAWVWVDKPEES